MTDRPESQSPATGVRALRRSPDRAAVLLALGALAGAGMAAWQLVGQRATMPGDAVALVGGVPITRSEYERALASVRADHRGELTEPERALVLDRLVDEELLLQRGLALELVRRDPRLRGELVSTLVAELEDLEDAAEQREPTDAELGRFLEANAERFPPEPVLRVEQIFFSVPAGTPATDVERRARAVAARLAAGEPWEQLRALGDASAAPLPSVPVPYRTLLAALGPAAARAALELDQGATSDLIRTGTGYVLVRVAERRAGSAPDLSTVRDEVRAEYLRRAGEARLRAALVTLRADTDVRIRGR